MQNQVLQAQKAGFVIGAHVVQKETEEAMIWKISKYDGHTVTLLQQHLGSEVGDPCDVDSATLLSHWKIYKGTVTIQLPGWDFNKSPFNPLESANWSWECVKGAINLAVRQVFETMYKGTSDMVLFVHPGMVKMKSNWKAGELMIAPATSRVERKEVPGAIPCGKFDLGKEALEVLYLAPMFTAPMSSRGIPNKFPWVSPFWHIPSVAKGQKANLVLKSVQKQVDKYIVKVPVLVNTKEVDETTELCWDKATARSFISSRSTVDEAEFVKTAKRRKL